MKTTLENKEKLEAIETLPLRDNNYEKKIINKLPNIREEKKDMIFFFINKTKVNKRLALVNML